MFQGIVLGGLLIAAIVGLVWQKKRAKRTDKHNPGNGALAPPGPDNIMAEDDEGNDEHNPGNGALAPPGPDNSMDEELIDAFEFDILILYTDGDRDDAYSFRSHLVEECRADLKVITWAEYGIGRPALQVMEDVFSKTRYIFVYVTEKLTEDGFLRLVQQTSIKDSFNDPVKKWRIVPVQATQEKINIFELNSLGGLNYSDWMHGTPNMKQLYMTTVHNMITRGRNDFQIPNRSSSRSDGRLVE